MTAEGLFTTLSIPSYLFGGAVVPVDNLLFQIIQYWDDGGKDIVNVSFARDGL